MLVPEVAAPELEGGPVLKQDERKKEARNEDGILHPVIPIGPPLPAGSAAALGRAGPGRGTILPSDAKGGTLPLR